MSITRPLAAGGLLATGVLVLLAASIALATDESPPPTGEPSVAPEPTPTLAAEPTRRTETPPATAPATAEPAVEPEPTSAATPEPATTPKPAATPAPAKVAEDTSPVETRMGTLAVRTDADGDREYVLDGVELAVGPPWFWGTKHPLEPYVGKSVTVTGRMDDGKPAANANGRARGSDGPQFEVYTVNGTTVRAAGKPPWAGGPKVVGESHPGFKGWSQGQGGRAGNTQAP